MQVANLTLAVYHIAAQVRVFTASFISVLKGRMCDDKIFCALGE